MKVISKKLTFDQLIHATSSPRHGASLFGAFGAAGGTSSLKLHEGDKSGGLARSGPKGERKRVRDGE